MRTMLTTMKLTLTIMLALAIMVETADAACVLKMGYRTNENVPLIAEAPDNSGLYYDLYKIAAEKIGCTLEVVRKTKRSIEYNLETGEIDFYPGFNFTEERSENVYYLINGLPGGNVGISLMDLPEITDLNQLKGKTMLMDLGGANHLEGIGGVYQSRIPEMSLDKAIDLIRGKKGHFYIYNRSSVEYYLKKNKITDIQIHPDCCGGNEPLYLAFSMKSKHFGQAPNSGYNKFKPLDIKNVPIIVTPDSVAGKLEKALKELEKSGVTTKLYNKYYH
ncbi:MAG: transporter substrate-binding domain-containing protein [SAR324 cluster bacterium]|nr:transporter substrate-binding domain-containing protein [SAR324 cluster bacterium]